jgi:hypothetical protein
LNMKYRAVFLMLLIMAVQAGIRLMQGYLV